MFENCETCKFGCDSKRDYTKSVCGTCRRFDNYEPKTETTLEDLFDFTIDGVDDDDGYCFCISCINEYYDQWHPKED